MALGIWTARRGQAWIYVVVLFNGGGCFDFLMDAGGVEWSGGALINEGSLGAFLRLLLTSGW